MKDLATSSPKGSPKEMAGMNSLILSIIAGIVDGLGPCFKWLDHHYNICFFHNVTTAKVVDA